MNTEKQFQARTLREATTEALLSAFRNNKIVYLNIVDFTTCLSMPDAKINLEPETEREVIRLGKYATYKGTEIYVSRLIPQGYYHKADAPVPELNWHSSPGERKQPDISSSISLTPLCV